MQKFDIINGIAQQLGFTRYLEVCTPTTGLRFGSVRESALGVRHRALYNCPDTYDDDAQITFRTPNATSQHMMATMAESLSPSDQYDIVFVDSFPEYTSSILDLYGALAVLKPTGVLVVHNCNPPNAEIAAPDVTDGSWCGVTYKAFVDFLIDNRFAGYCTVDTDFGCGVIFNTHAAVPECWRNMAHSNQLARGWAIVRDDDEARFAFFDKNRRDLMNLITPDAFRAEFPLTDDTKDIGPARASLQSRLRAFAKRQLDRLRAV